MITLFMFFLLCAIAGGAVLFVQLLGAVLGIGGDEFDTPDIDLDATDDSHSGLLFGLISFRTIVAALTFFGLFGLLAHSLGLPAMVQVLFGTLGGMSALVIVWWLMRTMRQLGQDATIKLDRAIGCEGTVHVTIPAAHRGPGKVMLTFHGRLEEYAATTKYPEAIRTGSRVRVIDVHSEGTLEVEPVSISEPKPVPTA